MRHNYADTAPNKLCGKLCSPITVTVCVTNIQHDILVFHIAKPRQSAPPLGWIGS